MDLVSHLIHDSLEFLGHLSVLPVQLVRVGMNGFWIQLWKFELIALDWFNIYRMSNIISLVDYYESTRLIKTVEYYKYRCVLGRLTGSSQPFFRRSVWLMERNFLRAKLFRYNLFPRWWTFHSKTSTVSEWENSFYFFFEFSFCIFLNFFKFLPTPFLTF